MVVMVMVMAVAVDEAVMVMPVMAGMAMRLVAGPCVFAGMVAGSMSGTAVMNPLRRRSQVSQLMDGCRTAGAAFPHRQPSAGLAEGMKIGLEPQILPCSHPAGKAVNRRRRIGSPARHSGREGGNRPGTVFPRSRKRPLARSIGPNGLPMAGWERPGGRQRPVRNRPHDRADGAAAHLMTRASGMAMRGGTHVAGTKSCTHLRRHAQIGFRTGRQPPTRFQGF